MNYIALITMIIATALVFTFSLAAKKNARKKGDPFTDKHAWILIGFIFSIGTFILSFLTLYIY